MTLAINLYTTYGKSAAGRFPQEMALAIAESGLEVTVISPHAEPEFEKQHANIHRLFLLDVPDSHSGKLARIKSLLQRTLTSFWMLAKARTRSRIFLITFIGQISAGLLHILWLRLLGAQIFFVIHDATPHAWRYRPSLRWIERGMQVWSYRLAQQLVTLTEAARQELIDDYGIAPDRISIIPHGAYIPPRTVTISGNGQVLLFGMLRRNKRIAEAIEAFQRFEQRFPRLKLLIAGDPHRDDLDYWAACAEKLTSAPANISVELGFIEEERLHEIIAQSDAVLLAYEEFNSQSGAAVLSAFSERVIIGTKVGGLDELASLGLEMVEIERPVSAETIANALERFATIPPEDLRAMATRSKDQLAAALDWNTIGRQYRVLIEKAS
jgi:glycogen(starch) synthase